MAVLMREAIGGSLRRVRTARRRTLRDVSRKARVSLGYLSEVERGRKEPSSELLAAICDALDIALHELLGEAAEIMAAEALEALEAAEALRPRRPVGLRHMDLRLAGVVDSSQGLGAQPDGMPLAPVPPRPLPQPVATEPVATEPVAGVRAAA